MTLPGFALPASPGAANAGDQPGFACIVVFFIGLGLKFKLALMP